MEEILIHMSLQLAKHKLTFGGTQQKSKQHNWYQQEQFYLV
jgi:hypothetical protein